MAFWLPNIMASMGFDKERLISLHEFMHKFFVEETVVSRIPDLSNLLPITLSELDTDKVHKNRVLFGTLCVSPFQNGHVQTIVEDMQGKACRIIICDVKRSEMGSMFPKGLKVAVKEPYLKTCGDGSRALFVTDPTEIERVAKFPTKVHPRLLKEEAWMKMGSFGRALEDENSALDIEIDLTLARAFAQVKEYKIARSILEGAIHQYPEEKELIDTFSKIVLSDDQS